MNNAPFSDIQPIKFWCQKILPLVYDNSLSYYEVLCKFSSKLNEIIDTLNDFQNDVYSYIDQQIQKLTADWTNKVNNILDEYTQNFDDKLEREHTWNMSQHAEILAQISAQLQIINNAITSGDNSLKLYIDSQIAELKSEIPKITSVMVVDPTTGQMMPIQQALDNIYTNLRCCALTASEYDSLLLTANEYDNYKLTARQYDCCGWRYLWPREEIGWMFSPFDGKWTQIKDVVSKLADLHRTNSPTAQEYDSALYTADEYDALNLSAYSYSWNFTVRQGG